MLAFGAQAALLGTRSLFTQRNADPRRVPASPDSRDRNRCRGTPTCSRWDGRTLRTAPYTSPTARTATGLPKRPPASGEPDLTPRPRTFR